MYRIEAATLDQMDEVRSLFREYAASLSVDLCFQNFEQELAGLPGKYDPILLAGSFAGCVALRPLAGPIAEAKRLYVRPAHRGHGLGRRLAEAIIEAARQKGYRTLRLDSLPEMREAITLYRRLGFHEIEPYCINPVPGAVFMEMNL
jgi:ribosomal protein S18 acetylase RimI-like enzyme